MIQYLLLICENDFSTANIFNLGIVKSVEYLNMLVDTSYGVELKINNHI